MITLQRADMKISAFLGEKKGIQTGDFIRPSIYAIAIPLKDKNIIFNTLTGQCIETSYEEWFLNPEVRNYDDHDIEMKTLVNANFLVKDNFDEASRYFKLIDLIRNIEKVKPGYTGYTILPTTSCNARCAYCFEQGMKYETMDEETINQTIQYIKETHREGAKIQLHWFGGEPLVGKLIISRISQALKDENIIFQSNMISNGSLMNEELAKVAKEDWYLNSVQITLDGREEVYCERKQYASFDGSPYRAVLDGIHALLKNEIRVSIRLNVDEENLDELHQLVDELEEEFSKETNVSIYCHSIFLEENDTRKRDDETFYNKMELLNERLNIFNKNRYKKNQTTTVNTQEPIDDANIQWEESEEEKKANEEAIKEKYYDRRGFTKRYYCMVDSPMAGPVILPNGNLCLCEHINEVPTIGTIWDTTYIDRNQYVKKDRRNIGKCLTCSFLPQCTDFTDCPTRNRDCQKETMAIEKRKLRSLENETKLPPITILYHDKRIRIKEPTKELAIKCMPLLTSEYIKVDSIISLEEAEELLKEF